MSIPDTTALPDLLYHYTDVAGLKGIVESGTIRATDLRFLNDRAELVYGIRSLEKDLSWPRGLSTDRVHDRVAQIVKNAIENALVPPIWITSFSAAKDDLSQWRAYSAGGGYCLAFDREQLKQCVEAEQFILRPCVYQASATSVMERPALFAAISAVGGSPKIVAARTNPRRRVEHMPEISEEGLSDGSEVLPSLMQDLFLEAATLKHRSFRGEDEWRALRSAGVEAEHVKFRTRGSTLIPFIEIPLGPNPLPLREIWRSPGSSGRDKIGLEIFCRRYADRLSNVEFKRSRSPYTTA